MVNNWETDLGVLGEIEAVMQYSPNSCGKCPHCLTGVQFVVPGKSGQWAPSFEGEAHRVRTVVSECPACHNLVIMMTAEQVKPSVRGLGYWMAWPRQGSRPVPVEVPAHIAQDYMEAALVISLSPKASAALSRRWLQTVLREAGSANQHNLVDQIEAVLPSVPTYVAQQVDAIRNIGNFAAHPIKSQVTGQIVDVEPGEAEWNLDVLDTLFDFYYVQPSLALANRNALNQKLQDAGKPPMK